MALAVFLRGVNVGGRRTFRPAVLAKQLTALEVESLGAAGTFVVRARVRQKELREELARRLPEDAEILILPARAVLELGPDDFPPRAWAAGVKRSVSVLARTPREAPPLPLREPSGADWHVELLGLRGRFVLSVWRRPGKKLIYPNAVVEKRFAMPATTRGWDTITKLQERLR